MKFGGVLISVILFSGVFVVKRMLLILGKFWVIYFEYDFVEMCLIGLCLSCLGWMFFVVIRIILLLVFVGVFLW